MRNMTEQNITALVTERYGTCPDPRLREVMGSLVKHLHAFVREIEPTEAEWMAGIDYLTGVGKMCDDKRQEFIILSDVLGVSILVDAINHRVPDTATPSTIVGPFHIQDSPDFDNGANMAAGAPGTPLVLTGTVSSLDGAPIETPPSTYGSPTVKASTKPRSQARMVRTCAASIERTRTAGTSFAQSHRSATRSRWTARSATWSCGPASTSTGRRTYISMCRPTDSNRSSRISFATATRTWTTTSSSRSRIDWSSISWSTSPASRQTASG